MRLRYLFFYFLAVTSVVPALAQDVPGSSIVSRTFLSPDGMYQGDGEIDTLSRTRNLSRNTMS